MSSRVPLVSGTKPARLAVLRRSRGQPIHGRRQMKTRRRWTWRAFLHGPIPQLLALLLVLGGVYGLATSRMFSITVVQAVGDNGLPDRVLRQNCQCLGANIFLTRPLEIRTRLGQRLPWLDVRSVYARLPDRLIIDVSYRQPVALWRTAVATYTVDDAGLVLYDLRTAPVPASAVPTTATVPLIYSQHDAVLASGSRVPTVALRMVSQLHAVLSSPLSATVDKFRWSPYTGLTAHSRKGWWFSLGIVLDDALSSRLHALENALRTRVMADNHCNYVDLRPWPNIYCDYELQWHWPLGPGTR